MIEFKGSISQITQKHLVKKQRILALLISIFTTLAVLPTSIWIAFYIKSYFFLNIVCAVVLVFLLLPLRPFTKGELAKMFPKKITIQDEYMVSVTGYGSESKLIEDVKEVRDYGEFYDIVFPIGKTSNNFICQKDLLVSGTIEEFEAKFKGKIVRK